MMSSFKERTSKEKRAQEVARIREKYQDRIPVICERARDCKLPEIDKNKFLVPDDLTVGQFVFVIRQRLKTLSSYVALYLFIDSKIPPTVATLHSLYGDRTDKEDGFLYVTYSGENAFGASAE
jgi:GABA(A) receptor-associated protein